MICTKCKKQKSDERKSGKLYKRCRECRKIKKCIHNKQKGQCKDCGGNNICVHKKIKSTCRECGGNRICVHKKIKSICKDCGGNQLCSHNKLKSQCKKCKGGSICVHNKVRSRCKDCEGGSICVHKRIKSTCRECGGSSICVHEKYKSQCTTCKPEKACTTPLCGVFVSKNSKYFPLCSRCYAYTYPDKKLPRKFKLKENIFFDAIREKYPELKMSIRFDKQIDDGCSKKRPDIFIDCLTHIIIGELDENEHRDYDKTCENRRIMELFQDAGNRPVVVLRLNPDSYYKDDEKYNSCFSYTKSGTISVDKKEWEKRMKLFTWHLDSWLKHIPRKEVTIRKFFYSS